jgi:hypothetical protein
MVEAGSGGDLVAEIAGQVQDPGARVGTGPGKQEVQCAVGTSVVDEDHFDRAGEAGGELLQLTAEDRHHLFFVVNGDYDRKEGRIRPRL